MKKIALTNRDDAFALVDDDTFEYLSQWKWRANKLGYPCRFTDYKQGGKRIYKCIFMHRVVNNTPDGLFTDHINRNKLDNRKENLRNATNSQNQSNRRFIGKFGFKGVHASREKYRARIKDGNKLLNLGTFTTAEEAARAFDKKAKELHGEFAFTNF